MDRHIARRSSGGKPRDDPEVGGRVQFLERHPPADRTARSDCVSWEHASGRPIWGQGKLQAVSAARCLGRRKSVDGFGIGPRTGAGQAAEKRSLRCGGESDSGPGSAEGAGEAETLVAGSGSPGEQGMPPRGMKKSKRYSRSMIFREPSNVGVVSWRKYTPAASFSPAVPRPSHLAS